MTATGACRWRRGCRSSPCAATTPSSSGRCAVLRDRLGLEPAERPLFDAAVAGGRAAGPRACPPSPASRSSRARGPTRPPPPCSRRLAEIAVANVPGTLDDLDPEFLHDLRVVDPPRPLGAARAQQRPRPRRRAPARRAEWAQALTGPVRDLDVQLIEWDELGAAAAERAAELEPLRRLLDAPPRARARAPAPRPAQRALHAALTDVARAGDRRAGRGRGRPDAGARRSRRSPATASARSTGAWCATAAQIDDDSPDEALHDLRKRGKELRYLLELFGGLFPAGGQADGLDAQGPPGRARPLPGPRRAGRAAARPCATSWPPCPTGPAALLAPGPLLDALRGRPAGARARSSPTASRPSPPRSSARWCATRSRSAAA